MLDNVNKPTVIALGYFDSVHLGHQKLITSAKEYADANGCTLTVFTFKGNLKAMLGLEQDKCVYLAKERQLLLKELGADEIYFAPISKTFLATGKLAFLNKLNKKYNIKAYFTGDDYTFGAFGKGDIKYLTEYAKSHNQEHVIVDTFTYMQDKVSTTLVKKALVKGDIKGANALLGRNYSITSKVIKDRKVGTKIGFPTANLLIENDKIQLKEGVYAGKIKVLNKEYLAIINYGARPTFEVDKKVIEAHLIDFDGNLYGKEITVQFTDFLREIVKFDNELELKEQLKKDLLKVKGEFND